MKDWVGRCGSNHCVCSCALTLVVEEIEELVFHDAAAHAAAKGVDEIKLWFIGQTGGELAVLVEEGVGNDVVGPVVLVK